MKATLFVIQNDADHAHAKALVEKLIGSNNPADQARMTAQARLIEAYERARWPHRTPALSSAVVGLIMEKFYRHMPSPASAKVPITAGTWRSWLTQS